MTCSKLYFSNERSLPHCEVIKRHHISPRLFIHVEANGMSAWREKVHLVVSVVVAGDREIFIHIRY